MNVLIQYGANAEAKDYQGFTPLYYAAFYNQKKACEKPQKQNVVTLLTFKVAWYSPIF